MLPWNYGFHWSTGSIIFLGAFYTVLMVVLTTVITAAVRSRRALASNRAEGIRWHSDFHDLPVQDRVCRHVLTGEFQRRECPNAFDCRHCQTHAGLIARHPLAPPSDPDEEIFGMPFPLDRLYHRGHTWLRQEADGTVTIGLDELGKRLIGEPDYLSISRSRAPAFGPTGRHSTSASGTPMSACSLRWMARSWRPAGRRRDGICGSARMRPTNRRSGIYYAAPKSAPG